MKRSLKASGLLSALSLSLFGVSVVGCSAEVKPDGEALGTTSQAYAGTFTPTTGGNAVSKDLQFSGEYSLNASQILVVGGYDKSGTAHVSAGIITNTGSSAGTWTPLVNNLSASNPLPTALGEVEVAALTASKFLIVGGRASRDGAAVTNAYVLSLVVSAGSFTGEAKWTAVNTPLLTGVVAGKNNVQKCGASHWIVIGGMTNGGMSSATTTATDAIQKFNYVPGTPATSSFETLKLGSTVSGTPKTVKLPREHGYHAVLHRSDTEFHVAGGVTSSIDSAIANVEELLVNSSAGTNLDCTATDASVVSTGAATPVLNGIAAMPSERARMAWIKSGGTINNDSDFTYDFIIATGNGTTRYSTTPPKAIFFYNSGTKTYYNASSFGAKDLTDGRVFGRLVADESGSGVRMGTGVVPDGTSTLLYKTDTATSTNTISPSGAIGSGTTITDGRVGSVVQLVTISTDADFACFGTAYKTTAPTSTAKTDCFDF